MVNMSGMWIDIKGVVKMFGFIHMCTLSEILVQVQSRHKVTEIATVESDIALFY
jgi:hypothetical protein